MATSLSISNSLCFLSPSKPPQKNPPPYLCLPCPSRTQRARNGTVSMAAQDSHFPLSTELSSVIYPSLAHSNVYFFKSVYNVHVNVEDNEPEERLLNRFRREVMRAGVIQECKRRRFFENKQEEKKRRTREAAKRNKRRRPQSRPFMPQNRQDVVATKKKDDDEEDNWEMPDGALPY